MKQSKSNRPWGSILIILVFITTSCRAPGPAPETPLPSRPTETAASTDDRLIPSPSLPAAGEQTPTTGKPSVLGRLEFANYQEPVVEVVPVLFHEPIATDLSNVRNAFILSEAHRQHLAQDGFVVSPGIEKEFFTVYEKARYANLPVFVTSDSILHVYHLLFDKVLRTAEVQYFIPLLRNLNASLLSETDRQYQELVGTAWEEAARRTVAFVAIASQLLEANVQVPDYSLDLVQAELAQIEAADNIQLSPLFPGLENGEDYTQYIPRGHYTRSDELKAYFKSMMWYGRMTFRLKTNDPEVGRAETRSALLLARALRQASVNGRPALEDWMDLYSPTVFFVGRSDDLTALQYLDIMDSLYGPELALSALADDSKLEAFIEQANLLPAPQILGIVIWDTDNIEETTKGMRFMGQRFVPDAYIFRQLIYRNVGTRERPRPLPKGMDIPAAMGSERAYQILEQMNETSFENYPQQMEKMRSWTASLTQEDWTETLYNTWLYSFYPLLEVPGEGYPAFMRSGAWMDKQLNTVLGSWAELKHDTILYAKQVYAELGGGPPPPPPLPPKGYVEPVPQFFARLAALTEMTRSGLENRGLLDELDRQSLETLENLARSLQVMAEKELSGEPLSEEEYTRIRFYGGEIENLTMAAADTDMQDPNAPRFMEEEPQAAVVADVATNPNPPATVLEEAVGRVNPIYVVVPIIEADGSSYLQVTKGGVFSYYEFPWPIEDRLTDEKWRQMLADGEAPSPPEWTQSFLITATEYDELSQSLFNFQQALTSTYWYQQELMQPEQGNLAAEINAQIQSWQAEKRYLGHQLLGSQIRSFDLESPSKAIITVRETWKDSLYGYQGEYPNYDEIPQAERGPYDLDATYTLEFKEEGTWLHWQVTRLVYANQAPEW
ncbi:MAG: DUF3160 domain-containing protein [Anaerolineales bacterium]|nr:MAG: DUF3160 domain-containing protein [Anaerolineales bacterium]